MATIHITRGTTSLGTFSEEEVREGLRNGRFALTDLAWREGMATWEPLSKWPEFGGTASPPSVASTITASAAPPMTQPAAPRSGLPWENRQDRSFFNAFIETLQMILSRPVEAFTIMRREGGLVDPLLYALIGGGFGLLIHSVYQILFMSLNIFADRSDPFTHLGMIGFGWFFMLVFIPVLIVMAVFISAAVIHLCLMLVGGAKQSFETTFRVVCYGCGSVCPLMIVPVCGRFIAFVWGLVLYCIGLARAHETDTGRAVLAVLLPVFVCCGGTILLIVLGVFGALAAFSHH